MSPIDCHKCRHYYVTWDKNFPHGCRGFGFKSRQPPNIGVRSSSSGMECLLFTKKGQKGKLIFNNCYMYRLGSPNDHGFYLNQFRYGPNNIEWGEFYELSDSNWRKDFPLDKVVVDDNLKDNKRLKHYLFFFRDNTFECIAENYDQEV